MPILAAVGLMLVVGLKVGLSEAPPVPRPEAPDFQSALEARFDYVVPPADWDLWQRAPHVPAPAVQFEWAVTAPQLPAPELAIVEEDVPEVAPRTGIATRSSASRIGLAAACSTRSSGKSRVVGGRDDARCQFVYPRFGCYWRRRWTAFMRHCRGAR